MLLSPLYAAVFAFCRDQLAAQPQRPLIVGIQGPQGAGKTTLAGALLEALSAHGLRAASVSIDDFYLTREGQLELSKRHPGHPYLEHRGYPGTHDLDLGEQTLLAARQSAASAPGSISIPVYDKSAHAGRGDRAEPERWRTVLSPLDVLLVEGWMLGFSPVPETSLADPNLVLPNRALADYARWHRHIDAWVILRTRDPNHVLTWRVEAEERMKQRGQPGLSRADIEDYVRRFLPAYRTWGGPPAEVDPKRCIELWIDLSRAMTPPV